MLHSISPVVSFCVFVVCFHLTISWQDLSLPVPSKHTHFFLFTAAQWLLGHTHHKLFNYSLWVDIWVISNFALTKDATKNNLVLTSFCTCTSVFSR